ncbi:MAG: hypothetical protein R2838_07190 [Caldilineaceae bacterium]
MTGCTQKRWLAAAGPDSHQRRLDASRSRLGMLHRWSLAARFAVVDKQERPLDAAAFGCCSARTPANPATVGCSKTRRSGTT